MRGRYPRLLYILLLAMLMPLSCDRAINRTAERRIREALPGLLGAARQYHVHVSGSALSTMQGQLSDVTIDGDDVEFANGLLLDHLHLDLKGVDYDTSHRRLRHIEAAQFTARIGQKSLDVFLAGEAPEGESLKHIEVILSGKNMVTISGQRVTLGLNVPFELTGPLRVTGPKRVEMDANRLKVSGIPITGIVLQFLKGRFENGINLSSLPFPIQLTGVSTESGDLTLSGTADVGVLLERLNRGQR